MPPPPEKGGGELAQTPSPTLSPDDRPHLCSCPPSMVVYSCSLEEYEVNQFTCASLQPLPTSPTPTPQPAGGKGPILRPPTPETRAPTVSTQTRAPTKGEGDRPATREPTIPAFPNRPRTLSPTTRPPTAARTLSPTTPPPTRAPPTPAPSVCEPNPCPGNFECTPGKKKGCVSNALYKCPDFQCARPPTPRANPLYDSYRGGRSCPNRLCEEDKQ